MAKKENKTETITNTPAETNKEPPKKPAEFSMIPGYLINESKTNPRKTFKAIEELAESIKAHGVLQPLLVRPITKNGEPEFELVAGARRYMACQKAGIDPIPCTIRELSDRDVLEIQVIENDQREEVNPMEQARGYQLLMSKGYDIKSLALKIGRDESYVYQRLRLNKLSDKFQEMLDKEGEGSINLSQAMIIAMLTKEDQTELYNQNFRWGRIPSASELRGIISREFQRDLSKAPFSLDVVLPHMPTCRECSKRSGYNPNLFPDAGKKDICGDTRCFGKKTEAYLQKTIHDHEVATGRKVQKIATSWISGEKDVLDQNSYEILNKEQLKSVPESEVKFGIIVKGEAREVGKIVKIKINPASKTRRNERTPAEVREAKKKREIETIHQRLYDETLLRVVGDPTLEALRLAAQVLFKRAGSDVQRYYAKLHKWEKPQGKNVSYYWIDERFDAELAKWTAQDIHKFFIERYMIWELKISNYGETKLSDDIVTAATLYGVDFKKIIADVREELAAGDKLKVKPAKKPAAKSQAKSADVRKCRVCGCTEDDCSQCIEKLGEPCKWVEQDLCSACVGSQSPHAKKKGKGAES